MDRHFFATLPHMEEVDKHEAEMVWLVYDLELDALQSRYKLVRHKTVYTKFATALDKITRAEPGDIKGFIGNLQGKLDEKLTNTGSPDAPTLLDLYENGDI